MAKKLTVELNVDYDSEGDVLYAFWGKPYDTTNYDLDSNFTLRVDSKTNKLVGLMIVSYKNLFPDALRPHDQRILAGSLLTLFARLLREKKLREPIVA